MMRTILRFFTALTVVLLLFPLAGRAAGTVSAGVASAATPIVLRDTLRTETQRSQFRRALSLAPKAFLYDSYSADGKSYASVTKLRFNDSMRNVLKFDFVQGDPFLHKQMRRLYLVTRPFGVTGDLSVKYKTLRNGALALEYQITNLCIWGRPASDRLIREILKANGAK